MADTETMPLSVLPEVPALFKVPRKEVPGNQFT